MTIENEHGILPSDIDETRKDCMRLCDKAVEQYKIAKSVAAKIINETYERERFVSQCNRIQEKQPNDRTINEIAMLKQYEDTKHEEHFGRQYDYEDDFKY